MNFNDESQLADHRLVHLQQLSVWMEALERRILRFRTSGWDINGLALMRSQSPRWRKACAQLELPDIRRQLLELNTQVKSSLELEQLPNLQQAEQWSDWVRAIRANLPEFSNNKASVSRPFETVEQFPERAPPIKIEPDQFAQWNEDEAELEQSIDSDDIALDLSELGDSLGPAMPSPVERLPAATTATIRSPASAAIAKPRAQVTGAANEALSLGVSTDFRLYHLTDASTLSVDLDQRLEAQGLEVELLADADELNELLSALPADLILIDAEFSDQLEIIGDSVRTARNNFGKRRVLVVALAEAEDIALRLSARRAGVDALIIGAKDASDVLRRLKKLLDPEQQDSYRVMIVEDDRSQALFAEGILRNAGMDSLVVLDALGVIPALEQFKPDLILMDLNMPGANGIELTALIREQDAFAHTPIVFLSGESSEDLQFDAIDAGGDDFLSKPIRPRNLISAVQSRVRRHRLLQNRKTKRPDKDAATGLVYRSSLLDLIADSISAKQTMGGLIYIEIESTGLLRERIGLSALELLLGDVSRVLTSSFSSDVPITRFGEGGYLLLDSSRDEAMLEGLAMQIRNAVTSKPFQALGQPLRLRLSIGICAFAHNFKDAASILNAAEKAARDARSREHGIARHEPIKDSEANHRAAAVSRVIEAMGQENLELMFQPVVAVAGGDVEQYQLLLRLRDLDGNLHSAAEVIPIAERSGDIVDIDHWVVERALSLIHEHRAQDRSLRLFVTQSPITLSQANHAQWLVDELQSRQIDGNALIIELRLEDVALNIELVRTFCNTIAPTGVRFCLSQFHSSAEAESMLDSLPLSFVKLARNYTVGGMAPAMRDELKMLINNAHHRGLEVIGHCVEDAQSAATLWMSGIDFIQGNLVQEANQDVNFDFNQAVL